MRLVEIYSSVQGEGPHVGQPTQFVRFGGCNLRCPGWACDTPFAIYPKEYRHTWEPVSPTDLAERIPEYPKNICLTGGEPLLQPIDELEELAGTLIRAGHTVEMFTNGTRPLPVLRYLITYVMDWKLPGSGEDTNDPIRRQNIDRLHPWDAIKFVCLDYDDYTLAKELYTEYFLPIEPIVRPQIYFGVVWSKLAEGELVEWILTDGLPVRLNVQMHNYLWPAQERGR